jgi:hypothetical protein
MENYHLKNLRTKKTAWAEKKGELVQSPQLAQVLPQS